LLAVIIVPAGGCFGRGNKSAEKPPSAFTIRTPDGATNVVVPMSSAVGRIAGVNAQDKIAVINFPIGQLPANNTRLAVFHAGTKTGELRITGPAEDTLTVGDIISGTAQEGDEVRAE
jgi:hypothetical protein